jgi:hypothetical protein
VTTAPAQGTTESTPDSVAEPAGRLLDGSSFQQDRADVGQAPTCPRCGGTVRPPGLWSSAWECAEHGPVAPYHVLLHPGTEALDHVTRLASVPVWLPGGLGPAWGCSGVAYAGDDRDGARATVIAMSGPSPLGGAADLLLVAEEPAVGLGARLAGIPDVDPGARIAEDSPDAKIVAARHPTPLWPLPEAAGDRAAFVGEAKGYWLWLIVWPAAAGVMVYDGVDLVDRRDTGDGWADLTFAAPSPHLGA